MAAPRRRALREFFDACLDRLTSRRSDARATCTQRFLEAPLKGSPVPPGHPSTLQTLADPTSVVGLYARSGGTLALTPPAGGAQIDAVRDSTPWPRADLSAR